MINETQREFKDIGIHIEKALIQHETFVKTLEQHGVEVILLPYHKRYPEQVFTRDIGFTLGQTVFVAKMANNVRIGEEEQLKEWLEEEEISFFNLAEDLIEGGDVIIDRDTIFIGISKRTNEKAIRHLQSILTPFTIITIPINNKYLHLDCVFNVVSPNVAIVYPPALTKNDLEVIHARYECIVVPEKEQVTLGTNVLGIGNKRIISLPQNKVVNKELRKRGFEVIEVDVSEIIKSGGAFRCCTLPILRKEV
jgi:N-dimethylarginine dimethylaminohydrolase